MLVPVNVLPPKKVPPVPAAVVFIEGMVPKRRPPGWGVEEGVPKALPVVLAGEGVTPKTPPPEEEGLAAEG